MKTYKVEFQDPRQWYGQVEEQVLRLFPQLSSVLTDERRFAGLSFKVKPDGTTMGILKRVTVKGEAQVLFATGYGTVGALIGLEMAMAGNNWRVDKPWNPAGSAGKKKS